MEKWKDIKGYEGLYQVSDRGNVASLDYRCTGARHLLSLGVLPIGYPVVVLCKDKKQKTAYVHRLVAEAFLEKPDGKCEVNHIDSCRSNNNVENLEWVTHSENMVHAHKAGRASCEAAWKASVEKSRLPVAKMDLFENVICIYSSLSSAAEDNSIQRENITSAARGKRKTAGGFKWKFVEKVEGEYGLVE